MDLEVNPNPTEALSIAQKAASKRPVRRTWFASHIANRFMTSSDFAKPVGNESTSTAALAQTGRVQTLAKRIRNAIRLKNLMVSPAVSETPVLELHRIVRPVEIQDRSWVQADLCNVHKSFGPKAGKYLAYDMGTKLGENQSELIDIERAVEDVGDTGEHYSTSDSIVRVLNSQIRDIDRIKKLNREC